MLASLTRAVMKKLTRGADPGLARSNSRQAVPISGRVVMRKHWSIRAYLWLLALAVALPCAGLLTYSILNEARHDQDQVGATTLSLAQLVASQTKQFLDDAENL